jgi:hypothetical protein
MENGRLKHEIAEARKDSRDRKKLIVKFAIPKEGV